MSTSTVPALIATGSILPTCRPLSPLCDRRRQRRANDRGIRNAYPISVRLPTRNPATRLRSYGYLPVLTERGAQIRLGDVADIRISRWSADAQKRECAPVPAGSISTSTVELSARRGAILQQGGRPRRFACSAGYSLSWSAPVRVAWRAATAKLKIVVPADARDYLRIALSDLSRSFSEGKALIIGDASRSSPRRRLLAHASLPLGYNMSIASAVGFIGAGGGPSAGRNRCGHGHLSGPGCRLLVQRKAGSTMSRISLKRSSRVPALRVRPNRHDSRRDHRAVSFPIMWGQRHGLGDHAAHCLTSPMVGGMITAPDPSVDDAWCRWSISDATARTHQPFQLGGRGP